MAEEATVPDPAIDQLPVAYRLAIHLREGGAPTDIIAEQLGIEPEAVGPLLALAASKLSSLRTPHDQATRPVDATVPPPPETRAPRPPTA